MKVALVYDWLNTRIGGGEQTLFTIAQLYPEADIFCLVYNKKKFAPFLRERKITTSRLNSFPSFIKKRPNLLLPFIEGVVGHFDFTGYDLVISVSSAWVKNISVPKGTCHISYCFSPARMIWDSWPKYLDTQKLGPFKLGPVSRFFVTRIVSRLRLWDYYASKNVFEFVSISDYISGRIQKYYHRTSKCIYPPTKLLDMPKQPQERTYFLCVSSLSQYKNIDLVIQTFLKNNLPLVIAGDGPDKHRLHELAGDAKNIHFAGRVSNEEKVHLLQNAKAFIFPSIEDFGIAPVEAMSAGTPVIALRGGGLLETVKEGKAGLFFDSPTVESLQKCLNIFKRHIFDQKNIHTSVEKFSEEKFKTVFPDTIQKIYTKWRHEQPN